MELHKLTPLLTLDKSTFWKPSRMLLPWVVVDIPTAHSASAEKADGFVALAFVEEAGTRQVNGLLSSVRRPVRCKGR